MTFLLTWTLDRVRLVPWLGARPHKPLEALGVRGQRQACPDNPLLYLCSLYNFVADINTHHRTNVEEFDYTLCGLTNQLKKCYSIKLGREECSFKCESVLCDLVLADGAGGGAEQLHHHGQPGRPGHPEALQTSRV